MRYSLPLYCGSIAAIFASPIGPKPVLAPPDARGEGQVLERFETYHNEVKSAQTETKAAIDKASEKVEGLSARLHEVEQKIVRQPGAGNIVEGKSLGAQAVSSEGFKAFVAGGARGTQRIEVKNTSSMTSDASSGGSLVPRDYRNTDYTLLPKRRLFIRDLVAPGQTDSNMVSYPQMVSRLNAAATVAEDPSAPKPMSTYTFVQKDARVQTIAHWVPVSQQLFQDAPALRSMIDTELLFGLADVEDTQLLMGDGTGVNLLGIMPQATPFNPTLFQVANSTMIDTLLMAIAQCELALLPATGIVLNPIDYYQMLAIKDAQGRYLAGGPFAALAEVFWQVPKVSTTAMPKGNFLVGAFQDGAQIFDRQNGTILFSTEDRDNFVRNMVTCLGEKRLAFAVRRPSAFVKGTFTAPSN